MKRRVGNILKKSYLYEYTIKRNDVRGTSKVYKVTYYVENNTKFIVKTQMIKKNLTPLDAENLVFQLERQ